MPTVNVVSAIGYICPEFNLVETRFFIEGAKDQQVQVCLYVKDQYGTHLADTDGNYRSASGEVSTYIEIVPPFENSFWRTFRIEFPYDQLHLTGNPSALSNNIHSLLGELRFYSPSNLAFIGVPYVFNLWVSTVPWVKLKSASEIAPEAKTKIDQTIGIPREISVDASDIIQNVKVRRGLFDSDSDYGQKRQLEIDRQVTARKQIAQEKEAQEAAQRYQNALATYAKKEALDALMGVTEPLHDGVQIATKQIPEILVATSHQLAWAESHRSNRYFAQFWESMSQASAGLHNYRSAVDSLRGKMSRYWLLRRRDPRFELLPDYYPMGLVVSALPLQERFAQIRQAVANDFQFESIWQQIQTRRAIVDGFASLGDMLHSTSNSLGSALAAIQNEVRLGFDDQRYLDECRRVAEASELRRITGSISGELRLATQKINEQAWNLHHGFDWWPVS